jgi:hypothetical protein
MDGLLIVAACLLLGIAAVILYLSDVSLSRAERGPEVRPNLRGQPQGPPPPLRRRKVPARGRSAAKRAPTPGRLSHAAMLAVPW